MQGRKGESRGDEGEREERDYQLRERGTPEGEGRDGNTERGCRKGNAKAVEAEKGSTGQGHQYRAGSEGGGGHYIWRHREGM